MTATTLTAWPPLFPKPLKEVISLFFALSESHSPDVGERLANEVFTPSGCYHSPKWNWNGSEEIKRSWVNAWSTVSQREYHVIRVYTFDTSFADIMMLCKSNHTTKSTGRSIPYDFTCRVVFDDPTAEMPKIKLLNQWTDIKPLLQAVNTIYPPPADESTRAEKSSDTSCPATPQTKVRRVLGAIFGHRG